MQNNILFQNSIYTRLALMLTVAYEAELANVDAFDQPGVEAYKRIMKEKIAKL